jgi:beta-glucosidase
VHQAKPGLPRPAKELKGFQKVSLKPHEKKTVTIPLDRGAFACHDPDKGGWLAEKGAFAIMAGGSPRDIRLRTPFTIEETTLEK